MREHCTEINVAQTAILWHW